MCEWGKENPWEWGFDCAQSWRMAGDHTPVWTSTKKQIQLSAAIPAEYTGKPYGWNDMDSESWHAVARASGQIQCNTTQCNIMQRNAPHRCAPHTAQCSRPGTMSRPRTRTGRRGP